MNKIFTCLLSILCINFSSSQNIILEKQLPNNLNAKQVFQVNDIENNRFALFLLGKSQNKSYLIEEDFSIKDSINIESLPKKYKTLLGTQVEKDNSYMLFLSTEGSFSLINEYAKPKYGLIKFSFDQKEIYSKELDLKFKGEIPLETFRVNNRLVILTISKKSSVLNFYFFDTNGNPERKSINCSDITFRYWNNTKASLHKILKSPDGIPIQGGKLLTIIDQYIPYSIKSTSELNKLYLKDNKLVFTLDGNKDFTQILTINLRDWSKGFTGFIKPKVNTVGYGRKSNSFLFEDKYFGLTLFKDTLKMEIRNLHSKDLLKTHSIVNNEDIGIKNSPIIIMDGTYTDYREVEKTNQYFRKINDYNIGISVSKYSEDAYEVSLGGVIPKVNLKVVYSSPSDPTSLNTRDPMKIAYEGVVGGRTTFIKCLLDSNFESIDGKVKQNTFERIKSYSDEKLNLNSKFLSTQGNNVLMSHLRGKKKVLLVKFDK